ncbi:MAG: TetR/AcrR family transcriptional regulator [Actinobacteria bacterium]|nr:TetR/AcrR family transcriptional regulator [Actinomycetota bacterium]
MTDSSLAPRKVPRQERSRRTVDRILVAAAQVFHEAGYTSATTNDIALEAGISVGSLYQYFPNKDALLVALTRRHIDSAAAGLVSLVLALSPEDGIRESLRTVVDFLVEQHALDELHLLVMHQAPRTHEISLALDEARVHLVEMTSHFLASQLPDDRERLLAARLVVATIDAGVHDVILREPRGTARQAAIEMTVDTAVSIIERSHGPKR